MNIPNGFLDSIQKPKHYSLILVAVPTGQVTTGQVLLLFASKFVLKLLHCILSHDWYLQTTNQGNHPWKGHSRPREARVSAKDTESFREWLENLDTAKTSSWNRGRERSSRKEEHTLKFLTWPLDRHVPFRWLKTDQFKQRDGYIQKVF